MLTRAFFVLWEEEIEARRRFEARRYLQRWIAARPSVTAAPCKVGLRRGGACAGDSVCEEEELALAMNCVVKEGPCRLPAHAAGILPDEEGGGGRLGRGARLALAMIRYRWRAGATCLWGMRTLFRFGPRLAASGRAFACVAPISSKRCDPESCTAGFRQIPRNPSLAGPTAGTASTSTRPPRSGSIKTLST